MEVNQIVKNAAKRFWEHINGQGRKTDAFHYSLTKKEGISVVSEEASEFTKRTIQATFAELGPKDIEQNTESNLSQDENTKKKSNRDDHGVLNRAESKVLAGTETGPNGIGIRLVKALGTNIKSKLRRETDEIIRRGEGEMLVMIGN